MTLPYALQKLKQMELLAWNQYVHLHFNSIFEIDIILIMFSFNKKTALKQFLLYVKM